MDQGNPALVLPPFLPPALLPALDVFLFVLGVRLFLGAEHLGEGGREGGREGRGGFGEGGREGRKYSNVP